MQYLNHHLHKYLGQFGVEKGSRINLEAFEEVVHALKQVEEHVMARTYIPCRLPNLITQNMHKKQQKGTDSEKNANASKDRFRVWEGLRSASEPASVATCSFPRTHQTKPISKSRGN